jgi:hypothetical protein
MSAISPISGYFKLKFFSRRLPAPNLIAVFDPVASNMHTYLMHEMSFSECDSIHFILNSFLNSNSRAYYVY